MDGILDQTSNQPPQYISRSLPMLDATAALYLFVGRIFLVSFAVTLIRCKSWIEKKMFFFTRLDQGREKQASVEGLGELRMMKTSRNQET